MAKPFVYLCLTDEDGNSTFHVYKYRQDAMEEFTGFVKEIISMSGTDIKKYKDDFENDYDEILRDKYFCDGCFTAEVRKLEILPGKCRLTIRYGNTETLESEGMFQFRSKYTDFDDAVNEVIEKYVPKQCKIDKEEFEDIDGISGIHVTWEYRGEERFISISPYED